MTTPVGQERPLARSLMPYYARTLKFRVPSGAILYRDQILDALAEHGARHPMVTAIGQAGSKSVWFIKFGEEVMVKQLCGEQLTIRSVDGTRVLGKVTLEMPFDDNVFVTYRLLWLPLGFEREKVKNLISKLDPIVQIVDVWEEKMKSNNQISTGNYLVKVKHPRAYQPAIRTGMHPLFGDWSFVVSRLGEPRKCLLCDSQGHIKRDCPRQRLTCMKCKGKYHEENECDYSWKLKAGIIKEQALLDDILDGEEEMQQESANAGASETRGSASHGAAREEPTAGEAALEEDKGGESSITEKEKEDEETHLTKEAEKTKTSVTDETREATSSSRIVVAASAAVTEGLANKRPVDKDSTTEEPPKGPKNCRKDDAGGSGGTDPDNTSQEDGELTDQEDTEIKIDSPFKADTQFSIEEPFDNSNSAPAAAGKKAAGSSSRDNSRNKNSKNKTH